MTAQTVLFRYELGCKTKTKINFFGFLYYLHDYNFLFSGPWGFHLGHFKNFLCMYVVKVTKHSILWHSKMISAGFVFFYNYPIHVTEEG